VFKRVLYINFEEDIPIEIISQIRYQFEKNFLTTSWKTKFLKLVVVRSFYFGLILSPPLAWIAKNGYLWVKYNPFLLSLPLANNILVKIIPNWRAFVERRRRMNNSMEWSVSLVFAEDSISLFNLWLSIICTWKHISHSTWKRYDQRYINELCVQNINQNS
jgi:hypothetical protein